MPYVLNNYDDDTNPPPLVGGRYRIVSMSPYDAYYYKWRNSSTPWVIVVLIVEAGHGGCILVRCPDIDRYGAWIIKRGLVLQPV